MTFRQNELSKLPFKLFKNLNPTKMWSIYLTPHLKRNTLIQEINPRREKTHFRKLLDKTCAVKFPASVKWILEAILSTYDDLKRKHLHPRHCSHPPFTSDWGKQPVCVQEKYLAQIAPWEEKLQLAGNPYVCPISPSAFCYASETVWQAEQLS